MLAAITLGCVCVAWAVAWVGSRRHLGGVMLIAVSGGIATLLMQRAMLAYLHYSLPAWLPPSLILVWDMMAMASLLYYVWTTVVEPLTVSSVAVFFQRMFADSRRRSSVRADVRRVAKQYRVEVA